MQSQLHQLSSLEGRFRARKLDSRTIFPDSFFSAIHFLLAFRFFHARNRFACCLRVRGFVNSSVRETLALDTLEGKRSTFAIGHAKFRTV
jgi:hypothetical protein